MQSTLGIKATSRLPQVDILKWTDRTGRRPDLTMTHLFDTRLRNWCWGFTKSWMWVLVFIWMHYLSLSILS